MIEPTVRIHLLRKDRAGEVLPMLDVEVNRVPAAGEHIGWSREGADGDPSKDVYYRVRHVLHIVRAKPEHTHVLAEVWATEDPSWGEGGASGPPYRWGEGP